MRITLLGGFGPGKGDSLNTYTGRFDSVRSRRGGTGVICILINKDGEEEEDAPCLPGYTGATNNQMEIRAPLDALKLDWAATRLSP